MNPFSTRKSAAEYIYMSDGYDGRAIVEVLNRYLPPGSSVLEIGMGPGRDMELLEEKYSVTGSDISRAFLDLYREKEPDADLLQLDLLTLETDRRFDCIYSNKVLHYLSPEQLRRSFLRQGEVLKPQGLLCHTIWYGDKRITVKGMDFHYYTAETISRLLGDGFELLSATPYREMDFNDSMLLFIRKK
jgi:trans-aconitate methyltransferase